MKEQDIRLDAILSSYIELSVQDAEFYFKNEERVYKIGGNAIWR